MGALAPRGAVTLEVITERATIPVAVSDSDVLVVLAHGAGSHMDHPTILWLSTLVHAAGVGDVRFNFAYRTLGRSMPDRMPILMDTYRSVVEAVREKFYPRRLFIGGHSMGGRVASMLAAEGDVTDGLLLFGYPLHPPGQFTKLRDAHLMKITCPVLQISGTRDDFCRKDLMESVPIGTNYRITWIEGADHGYAVPKASGRTRMEVEQQISEALASFLKTS